MAAFCQGGPTRPPRPPDSGPNRPFPRPERGVRAHIWGTTRRRCNLVPGSLVVSNESPGRVMDDQAERHLRDVHSASYRRLVGQLFAVCGDLGEAEEVVQEAFVRAAQHAARFVRVDNPEAWLRTTAVNLSRTRYRRRVLGQRLLMRESPPISAPELSPDRVAVLDALRRLPAAQREAIALHHLADLPVDEVARNLGVSPNTIKSRLRRGRAALAELLDVREEAPHA